MYPRHPSGVPIDGNLSWVHLQSMYSGHVLAVSANEGRRYVRYGFSQWTHIWLITVIAKKQPLKLYSKSCCCHWIHHIIYSWKEHAWEFTLQDAGNNISWVNSSLPGKNGRNFADDISSSIFVNEKFCVLIQISLKFVAKGTIDNIRALV